MKVYYFFKSYLFDIIASILAVVLAGLQFSIFLSVVVIVIYLFVIIYLRSREKDFYFIPLDDRKNKDDWIGTGKFEYSRISESFLITQSDPGYIYSKCLNWSDYRYKFDFKIRKSCLGVVLRAVNLSNYVMMQINQAGIRPHLRINGGWNVWEAAAAGLVFDKKLAKEKWYTCELTCDKDVINIRIFYNKELLFDEEWIIPVGNIVFSFPRGPGDPQPVNIPFPINLEYGSAGFRNSGDEKALIKNVLIEKI